VSSLNLATGSSKASLISAMLFAFHTKDSGSDEKELLTTESFVMGRSICSSRFEASNSW
jgi:hypothetical protein